MSTATVSQQRTQRNPHPDTVCTGCGNVASRCICSGGRHLPSERIELAQSSDGWHWVHIGKRTCRNTSMVAYPTPLAAAIDGARYATSLKLQLYTGDSALNQDMIMHWQLEGIEAAKAAKPDWTLWNTYQRQGYESIINPTFGWVA